MMLVTSTPNFYLDDLARKRKRSDELRGGLSQGFQGAIGGLDSMGKLLAAIEAKDKADANAVGKLLDDAEAKAHGRETEARNQARADERFGWERIDRERKDAEYARMAPDAEVDRRALMERALAGVESDVAGFERDDEVRAQTMSDALANVDVGPTSEDIDRKMMMDRALASVADEGPGSMTPGTPVIDPLTQSKIDANRALAELRDRTKRGGAAPKTGGALTDKQRRDKALADKAEMQANKLRNEAGSGGAKPKVSEAEAVTELDVALGEARRLASEKGAIDTGPIANILNFAAQKTGLSDPMTTQFKATIGEQLAQYIKSISGATVAATERAALLENVPTFSDNDDEFVAKLGRVISMLDAKRQAQIRAQQIAGKDVSGYAPTGSGIQRAPESSAPVAPRDLFGDRR